MKIQYGFTLVEVLVAIAIFAVLSAAGWQVFDQLLKTRERNDLHVKKLMQLQTGYSQILRDLNQVAPITGAQNGEIYPALFLENQNLQFNKTGVIDPLQQGLDHFEFIEYQYDIQQKALKRYKAAYIYRQDLQNMQADIVLAPIEDLRFRALDPAIQERWPAQTVMDANAEQYTYAQLPKGIEMTFKYEQKEYRWVFSLIATPVNPVTAENTAPQGDNNENS